MAGEVSGNPIKSTDDRAWKLAVSKTLASLVKTVALLSARAGLSPTRGVTPARTGSGGGSGTVDSTARSMAQQALDDLDRPRTSIVVLGATGSGTMTIPEAFRIVHIQASNLTSTPRIRFYRSSADRTADSARPYTTARPADGSVIDEYRWTTAATFWSIGYISSLISGSTTLYYAVDGGTADITLTYIRED